MIVHDAITQPQGRSNLDLISHTAANNQVDYIDIAAAYVTTGGARDLLHALRNSLGTRWPTVEKRWLVAFDYCRTEPLATQMLANAPRSSIRIHDGTRVTQQKLCTPIVPFHPKAYLFRGPAQHAVFAGSGNVSQSGLNTGHEVGLLLSCGPPAAPADNAALVSIRAVQTWYNSAWDAATPLDQELADRYGRIYDSVENRRQPIPTEDDPAPSSTPGSLTAEDLRKLRVCRHLWIEAGNVTRNLGRNRPGNQLMMKRLSRVFFGVPATNVPQNSPLTRVQISYDGVAKPDCSLTFSDNGMDKLTLPLPGAGGPTQYDGGTLLFTRVGAGEFTVALGSAPQKQDWIQKSTVIAGRYTMPSQGRRWGVF